MTGAKSEAQITRWVDRMAPDGWRRLLPFLQRDPRTGVRRLAQRLARRLAALEEESLKDDELRTFDASLVPSGGKVAGVDEVGRGALAGPLVAAAVLLRPGTRLLGLDDSKRLTPNRRESLVSPILRSALAWSIAVATPQEIDRRGIGRLNRTLLARAAMGLPVIPDLLVVDAFRLEDYPLRQHPVIGADRQSQSVAAASVLAKVVRDRMMARLGEEAYPGYGFEGHVGYGASTHVEALKTMGPTLIHRHSFLGFLDDL